LLAGGIPAVWISVLKVEQIPHFIMAPIQDQAAFLAMLFFPTHEAGLAIVYPLFLFYCAVFGTLIGKLCRFVLSRRSHHDDRGIP
jgi:hypothetical protein